MSKSASILLDSIAEILREKGRTVDVRETTTTEYGITVTTKSIFAPGPNWYDATIMAFASKVEGKRWTFGGMNIRTGSGQTLDKTTYATALIAAEVYA